LPCTCGLNIATIGIAGGLMHGSGANTTPNGRKCLLSAFQLGWLRPEYKFWAHKELHQVSLHSCVDIQDPWVELPLNWQALLEGKLSARLSDLMGHVRLGLAIAAIIELTHPPPRALFLPQGLLVTDDRYTWIPWVRNSLNTRTLLSNLAMLVASKTSTSTTVWCKKNHI
jgi:hypothetical protein